MAEGDIIAGLDIGTTKVSAIIAEQTDEGIDIIGTGSVPVKGVRRGVVCNIEGTVQAIRAAVEQAGTMAGVDVGSVFVSISGSHVHTFNNQGVAAIQRREVRHVDVERVLEQARAIPLSSDREVLHVLPQEYVVDDQEGVKEPIGMSGVRLEARVHMVTAARGAVDNVMKCIDRCGLEVDGLVLSPLASADAVLSEDEKEIGAVLVDMGGGTTDVILYVDGAVALAASVPMGGANLTNDIASCLRTPVAEAERVKTRYGCASPAMMGEGETMEVPSVGGRAPRTMERELLGQIIEARVEEIFEHVKQIIDESGYGPSLAAGAVLTGGATLLDGLPELAEQLLDMPVRRGGPVGVGGLVDVVRSPAHAVGVGLAKHGAAVIDEMAEAEEAAVHVDVPVTVTQTAGGGAHAQGGPAGAPWWRRIGGWVSDVF